MSDLRMSAPEVAATRKLIGLTLSEVAEALGVNISTARDWERGRFQPREGLVSDLLALRDEHDGEFRRLLPAAQDGIPIYLPRGPRPAGWYLALGARLLDRVPDVMLEWVDHG